MTPLELLTAEYSYTVKQRQALRNEMEFNAVVLLLSRYGASDQRAQDLSFLWLKEFVCAN